jgi:hypothetical protein
MWFETLMGFREETPEQVRSNISVSNGMLRSKVNGKEYAHGLLETPSLGELRQRVQSLPLPTGKLTVREVIGDVQKLHSDAENTNALFQVASQFNLLEMMSPENTPEQGVGRYEHDHTQGPACAIAAGAGTIYRNYCVEIDEQMGQTKHRQIDCLSDLGSALGNDGQYWKMVNGYALATEQGLRAISDKLSALSETERDALRQLLRVGVQWNTEVTTTDEKALVSQIYCSALPVAYSEHSSELWSDFAQLVLEAAYEATLCAAVLNSHENGNNTVYLTLLGGGAFGNENEWIFKAIRRALGKYQQVDLDVAFVSYGGSNLGVQELITGW